MTSFDTATTTSSIATATDTLLGDSQTVLYSDKFVTLTKTELHVKYYCLAYSGSVRKIPLDKIVLARTRRDYYLPWFVLRTHGPLIFPRIYWALDWKRTLPWCRDRDYVVVKVRGDYFQKGFSSFQPERLAALIREQIKGNPYMAEEEEEDKEEMKQKDYDSLMNQKGYDSLMNQKFSKSETTLIAFKT